MTGTPLPTCGASRSTACGDGKRFGGNLAVLQLQPEARVLRRVGFGCVRAALNAVSGSPKPGKTEEHRRSGTLQGERPLFRTALPLPSPAVCNSNLFPG